MAEEIGEDKKLGQVTGELNELDMCVGYLVTAIEILEKRTVPVRYIAGVLKEESDKDKLPVVCPLAESIRVIKNRVLAAMHRVEDVVNTLEI